LVLPAISVRFAEFWDDDRLPQLLPKYLFLLHAAMRASVPLMETARQCARTRGPEDRVAQRLVLYFDDHIPEEHEHDRWLLDDMRSIGIETDEVLTRVVPPVIASLVGAQYYWIRHNHPVALLGYIAVLEGYPPDPRQLMRAQERTGLPPAVFRTLLEHAQVDEAHAEGLIRLLNELELSERQSALVSVSALHTADGIAGALGEVFSSVHSGSS
jgi:hypothetical protein